MKLLAPLMQWGWNSYGEALTMVFASILTTTKQSMALNKVYDGDKQVLDEKLRSEAKYKGHKKMTREEFEASLVQDGEIVEMMPPTMQPTRGVLSREEFESAQIVEKGESVVVIPQKKKKDSEEKNVASKLDREYRTDYDTENALFVGETDSIAEEERIRAPKVEIVEPEKDVDYFDEKSKDPPAHEKKRNDKVVGTETVMYLIIKFL